MSTVSSSSISVPVAVSYAGAKLYYSADSCGAASFISAYKAGLKGLQLEQVDIFTHLTSTGKDFYSINPKGNVPTLVLADGTVLNEGAAVLQFIADQKPEAKLAAPYGTVQRYRIQTALNHISSELHARISAVFATTDNTIKEFLSNRVAQKLAYFDKEIKGQFYAAEHFTIADSYLYIVLSWTPFIGLSLDKYPNLKKYFEGIKGLNVVQEANKIMAANPNKLE